MRTLALSPVRILTWSLLGLVGLLTLMPAYWLVVCSLKPSSNIVGERSLIPSQITLDNWVYAFTHTEIGLWLVNTAIVGLGATLLGILITSLAAYALAKQHFWGRDVFFIVMLASLAIPDYVTLIPSFIIAKALSLLNSHWSVILPYSASVLATFLLRQYIRQVPDEILDAARIDGCSEFQIYRRIVLPLIKPGLGAATLLIFLHSWNAYLYPLVMLRTQDKFTIPLGIAFIHGQLDIHHGSGPSPWATIMVGGVLSMLPLVVCLMAMQKQFISGLTAGAMK